jgi:dienelactone hydrolase
MTTPSGGADPAEVVVEVSDARLGARLERPPESTAVVVFAHGSGSSRHSPRNRLVARQLEEAGLGTLLVDLLTDDEADQRGNVFDIDLLARRLRESTQWVRQVVAGPVRVGYFGASTGAAAALVAAAEPAAGVAAIVSRGGRPDLAGPALAAVKAPTLLIVGGRDEAVLELNRAAQTRLPGRSRLEIVPGATHLFPEAGALTAVARLARSWFDTYLAG